MGWVLKSIVEVDESGNEREFSPTWSPPMPNFHRMSRREIERELGMRPPEYDPPFVEREGGYLVPESISSHVTLFRKMY